MISSDGVVYAVDSSDIAPFYDRGSREWEVEVTGLLELLEQRAFGQLVKYDLKTGECELMADGLKYPNGLHISPKEDYLLIHELTGFKVARYWLKGPKAGTRDDLIANMPCLGDNISRAPDGKYVIGMECVVNNQPW